MARIRKNDLEIDISDLALVVTILGLAAAGLAALWIISQNPALLRPLIAMAQASGRTLIHRGHRLDL